jgi:hypothetical protein
MSVCKNIDSGKFIKPPEDRIDFLVVGAQKCGTSSIDYYLSQHPDIATADVKEVHYFDDDTIFNGREPSDCSYQQYHSHFDWTKECIRGECTPIYMYWDNAIERIYDYNPEMKIIVILRNPMLRAFSHYNMESIRGADSEDFCPNYESELARVEKCGFKQHRVISYIDRGFYYRQVNKILKFFPRKNIYAVKYEQYKSDNNYVMQNIFRFLNVKSFDVSVNDIFKMNVKTIFNVDQYIKIQEILWDDIKRLEILLGWDCSDWLGKPPESFC